MDYKKYSLENLENWLYDAMSAGEATPQEIYDVIVNVVKDNYYTYKHQTSQAYELLTLLNGNNDWSIEDALKEREYYEGWDPQEKVLSCDKDDPSPECKDAWNSFWEDSMTPWGHSDLEALSNYYPHPDQPVSTEEELNSMCEKAKSDQEKEKCREYNLREAEYYNKRAELDSINEEVKAKGGYDWTPISSEGPSTYVSEDGDVFANNYTNTKEDKVKKWVLPTQVDGLTGDVIVNLPDDLLERSGLKEGDLIEWIDRKDGSFELRKVNGTK